MAPTAMGLKAPATMDTAAVHSLCNRLSTAPDVDGKLPWSLRSRAEGATQDEKREHLQGLLERDAALFLEKYGGSLSGAELSEFEVLKGKRGSRVSIEDSCLERKFQLTRN